MESFGSFTVMVNRNSAEGEEKKGWPNDGNRKINEYIETTCGPVRLQCVVCYACQDLTAFTDCMYTCSK